MRMMKNMRRLAEERPARTMKSKWRLAEEMKADPAFKDSANVAGNLATLTRANIASQKAPAPIHEIGRLKTAPGLALIKRRLRSGGRH